MHGTNLLVAALILCCGLATLIRPRLMLKIGKDFTPARARTIKKAGWVMVGAGALIAALSFL